jgi:transposase InsO family protein
LNRRQARWSIFLADFDFEIQYQPGTQQGKADALSRRSEYELRAGDEAYGQQNQTLLNLEQFRVAATISTLPDSYLVRDIKMATEEDTWATNIKKELQERPRNPNRDDLDQFEQQDGHLLRNNLIYVPEGPIRLKILRECHDNTLAGHFGMARTHELVSRNYWWPKMNKLLREYVKSCDTCARSKAPRHRPFGLLQPLPIPSRPWGSIAMDFITDLPTVRAKNSILVVVDRLTKMAHFTPCSKLITAEETAQLILDEIVQLHGLPEEIVSDRGPQFASKFWHRLFKLLGVDIRLSSAFHPETDGQTERTNQTLEQYLRCTVNYQQDDWLDLLSQAEFAYNNTTHASTGISPFFANYGFHPRFSLEIPGDSVNPSVEERAMRLGHVQQNLMAELKLTQEWQKKQADRRRKDHPNFKVGDKVWLLRKNIATTRPCAKLDYKRLGPFKIAKLVGLVACQLELPPQFKIHNVFHVSLLEPYHDNPIPERHREPPVPVKIEGQEEFEVQEVLDSKKIRGKLLYLVFWRGYPPSEATWEPAGNLVHAQDLVNRFHQRYPNKPAPSGRVA